ncbi:virulence factor TspB C-terminal domain-related protein [Accumulibacter sp.]|uniref:virulence factor TspB C-terminal domain-related protein n=1 Tax=Accumulibacter sp. TaxID=2053492 RepID=UPI00338E876F
MGYRKPDGTCDPCPGGKYAYRELAGHLGADDTPVRWGSPFELSLYGSGASVPDSVCHQGCTLDLAGGDLSFAGSGGPSGQWSWSGSPKFSGATCSVSPADPAVVQPNSPEAACVAAGQGYGTVNGTVVCVPQVDTKRREVKEVTGPAGGKTVTVDNQVCTGGSCTSTTTVTNSGGGAVGGQPDGSSTSSAVGGSSTKGDGRSACEENPYSTACLGNAAGQEGLGQGDGGGGISSISPVALPGAAVCPADLQLPHGVSLPFRHACEFAVLIQPFVLILGWLTAGFFVVGGLRSG